MANEAENSRTNKLPDDRLGFLTAMLKKNRLKEKQATCNPSVFTIPKSAIIAGLISVFFLSYIIIPYWDLPGNLKIDLIIREITLVLGILWGVLAAEKVNLGLSKSNIKYFLFSLLIILSFNLLPLISVIPWRGDEDLHIQRTLYILSSLPQYVMPIGALIWVLVIYLSWHKPKWAIFVGAMLLFFMVTSSPQFNEIEYVSNLARYPYISYWFFAFVISIVKPLLGNPFHEVLFRIIPFLSVVALAWTYQRVLPGKQRFSNFVWGIAIALIPSVYYYTSILYLEMPIVLLMTIVCLRIEKLLTLDFSDLKQDPGWYALILVGFLKETTLPFMFCFILIRTAIKFGAKAIHARSKILKSDSLPDEVLKPGLKSIQEEVIVYFLLLLPVVYYLLFRLRFNEREYQLTLANLVDPSVYPVIFRALFEQFGAWIVLFIAGCVVLTLKKKFSSLLFYCFLFFGYILFFTLDQKIYVGYSRFYLFLLPPLLAGASMLIKYVIEKRKQFNYVLVALVVISSLLLSPVQRDGTKVPYWGNYFFDTSEHYYPVDEALKYLKENDPEGAVLFAGLYFRYFDAFYYFKYNWWPDISEKLLSDIHNQDDQLNLSAALSKAEADGFDNVLFFVLQNDVPQVPVNSRYKQKMVFSNLSHILVLYSID